MTVPSTPRPVVLEALNLATGQVMPFPSPPIVQQSDEYISGITFVDGQLVAALTPASPATNAARPTRLFLQGPPHTIVSVVGLQRDEELRSIVGSRGGRLLGFVAKQNGTPPFRLVEVDRRTGTVSAKVTFDNQRLRALASCHDGTLYTTGVEQDGTTSLLRLDEQNGTLELLVTLHVSNRGWDNGLHSLLCSPAHQLLAFGALRYQSPKALYSVDVSSGAMTKLSDFDTAAVTLFS
jgi:hypothetical protein